PALEVQLAVAVEGPAPHPFDDHHDDASAIEGEQRQKIGDADGDGQQRDELDIERGALVNGVDGDGGDPDRAGNAVWAEKATLQLAREESAKALDHLAERQEREADTLLNRGERCGDRNDEHTHLARVLRAYGLHLDAERLSAAVDALDDHRLAPGVDLRLAD